MNKYLGFMDLVADCKAQKSKYTTWKFPVYQYREIISPNQSKLYKGNELLDVLSDTVILGLPDGHTVTESELIDARGAFQQYASSIPNDHPMKDILDDYNKPYFDTRRHVRELWAQAHNIKKNEEIIDSYSIVNELIDMAEKFINNSDNYIDLTLKFCKKHGMPLLNEVTNPTETYESINLEIQQDRNRGSFFHPQFCLHFCFDPKEMMKHYVIPLYQLYLIWRYLIFQFPDDMINDNSTVYSRLIELFENEPITHEFLYNYVNKQSQRIKTNEQIVVDKKGIVTLVTCCDTLMDAAILQVLRLIYGGQDALNGRMIARCRNCSNVFVKSHGNAKLCGECNPNKERIKACRARKAIKGGIKDAQKARE